MLSVFEIELPREKDPDKFVAFMQDEYMPAVHMGPTRVGQVDELKLLRAAAPGGVVEGDEGTSAETGHRFLWLVDWHGLSPPGARLDDEKVLRKFERFGATIKDEASWQEVARRP